MNHIRKVFLGFMPSILALCLMTGPNAYAAASENSLSDAITKADISKCMKKEVPELISIALSTPNDYFSGSPTNISIGSAFHFSSFGSNGLLYENEQVLYFPIYSQDDIVSILSMSKYNGEISVSLGKDFSNTLNQLLTANNQVALFDDNQRLNAISDSGECVLLASDKIYGQSTQTTKKYTFDKVKAKSNVIKKEKVNVRMQVASVMVQSIPSNKYLSNYPIVAQGNLGICWAATIASMVRFEKPSLYGSDLTGEAVCDAISHAYEGATWEDIMKGMKFYLTSPYLPTLQNSAMSSSSVITVINNNDPALMGNIQVGGPRAHHTALCGYIMGQSSFTIRLMDPAYACFKLSTQTASGFTFPFGNLTFKWDKTIRLYYS